MAGVSKGVWKTSFTDLGGHVPNVQEQGHPEGHDYVKGSPHLRHEALRTRISQSLTDIITAIQRDKGTCKVLEVGAGHGVFTESLLRSGATVVVTEMSAPSATHLQHLYGGSANVEIVHDPTGEWLGQSGSIFDAVMCISVLHHIPNYLGFLDTAFRRIEPGGAFVSWQDPLWYPRRSRMNLAADQGAYYSWRLTQGQLRKGFSTRLRRLRGTFDEHDPADMVEYHVVRDGVDEMAILELGNHFFESTNLLTYWSTQSAALQRLGKKLDLRSTFGLSFTHRR